PALPPSSDRRSNNGGPQQRQRASMGSCMQAARTRFAVLNVHPTTRNRQIRCKYCPMTREYGVPIVVTVSTRCPRTTEGPPCPEVSGGHGAQVSPPPSAQRC